MLFCCILLETCTKRNRHRVNMKKRTNDDYIELTEKLTGLATFSSFDPLLYHYFGDLVNKGPVSQERPTTKSTFCLNNGQQKWQCFLKLFSSLCCSIISLGTYHKQSWKIIKQFYSIKSEPTLETKHKSFSFSPHHHHFINLCTNNMAISLISLEQPQS